MEDLHTSDTVEGLDKKFSLHYYSRLRFTEQLLPLLSKAAENPAEPGKQPLARVISVLGAGLETHVDLEDFDLKHNFSLKKCADHAITGTSLAFDLLSRQTGAEKVTFIHSSPGVVMTGISRNLPGYAQYLYSGLGFLIKPLTIGFQESGERHIFAATADDFSRRGVVLVGQKSDIKDSGKIMTQLRANGTGEKVWQHTQDVFAKICKTGATL